MRQLIVLPGNSPQNEAWGDVAVGHTHVWFEHVHAQAYDHWETSEQWIDMERELTKLGETVAAAPTDAEFVIFAKSVGSILTFEAVHRGIIAPVRCAFFGIPFDMAAERYFAADWSAVDTFSVPSVAFHNRNDPTADHDITGKTIEQHAAGVIMFVSTDGDDHAYFDFATYEPYLTQLLDADTATN